MSTTSPAAPAETKPGSVLCENSLGTELQGEIVRLTRHAAVFEIHSPYLELRLSESLNNFQIQLGGRVVYSGRAVVSNLVNAGAALVCEAKLEDSWVDVDFTASPAAKDKLRQDFLEFVRASQQAFKILPEFKLVVADMQIFLQDLRHWFDQLELRVLSEPSGSRQQFEHDLIDQLQEPVLPLLGMLFEKFEECCKKIEPDLQPAHRTYVQRQLHPLVLCAPFMYRTFRKPLGYAGDYEMVNMMMREPKEGASVFAKMLNSFFLKTPPVIAHRNRIQELKNFLTQETARVMRENRDLTVFNLGCGPAQEVQEFLGESSLSARTKFTLLDFNEETLAYTGRKLNEVLARSGRLTPVRLVRKSVAQVLKEGAKPNSSLLGSGYDLVYCAGLFDYMPDMVCKQLMSIFYRMLAPQGLLVATNVDNYNPSRNWMEYSVDWHLVYRDATGMADLVPETAPSGSYRIFSDLTGVNTFVEIRKPAHA